MPTASSCPGSARSRRAWRGCPPSTVAPRSRNGSLRGVRCSGICVGMQVLFDAGVEHGVEAAGLGVLPGGSSACARRCSRTWVGTPLPRRRIRTCSPASTRTRDSTSCTRMRRARRAARCLHRARRAIRVRGGGRCGQRDPVPPGEVRRRRARRCSRTGCARYEQAACAGASAARGARPRRRAAEEQQRRREGGRRARQARAARARVASHAVVAARCGLPAEQGRHRRAC